MSDPEKNLPEEGVGEAAIVGLHGLVVETFPEDGADGVDDDATGTK
jgi:hypothetical protein